MGCRYVNYMKTFYMHHNRVVVLKIPRHRLIVHHKHHQTKKASAFPDSRFVLCCSVLWSVLKEQWINTYKGMPCMKVHVV